MSAVASPEISLKPVALNLPYPIPFDAEFRIVKTSVVSGDWIVEGYAATSDLDLQADVITPEALKASAEDLIQNSTVLWNHDTNRPIGKVLFAEGRPGGLFVKVRVSKTEPEIWQKIQEGVLNKFSISGDVIEADRSYMPDLKRYGRVIRRMRLGETSLVSVPANPNAETLGWYVAKALRAVDKEDPEMKKKEGEPAVPAVEPSPEIVKAAEAAPAPVVEAAPVAAPELIVKAAEPPAPAPVVVVPPVVEPAIEKAAQTQQIVELVLAELRKAPPPAPAPAPAAEPGPASPDAAPPSGSPDAISEALDALEAWCKEQASPDQALGLIATIRDAIGKAASAKPEGKDAPAAVVTAASTESAPAAEKAADLPAVATDAEKADGSFKLQTIIFSKDKFTVAEATKWAKDHNFRHDKIDEPAAGNTIRLRQFDPSLCKAGSERTIELTDGVKAVGCLSEAKTAEAPIVEAPEAGIVKALETKIEELGEAVVKLAGIVAENGHPLGLRKGRTGDPNLGGDPAPDAIRKPTTKIGQRQAVRDALDRIFPDKD